MNTIVFQLGKVLNSKQLIDSSMNTYSDIGLMITLTIIILIGIIGANSGYGSSFGVVDPVAGQRIDLIDAAMNFSYLLVSKIGTDSLPG